jgi:hypothetical protein
MTALGRNEPIGLVEAVQGLRYRSGQRRCRELCEDPVPCVTVDSPRDDLRPRPHRCFWAGCRCRPKNQLTVRSGPP